MSRKNITVSAPGKIHLLGEHSVVYGKPAIIASIDLRVFVTLSKAKGIYSSPAAQNDKIRKIIEPIVKKGLKIKTIPSYSLNISSQLPVGSGLGYSAAMSASYIGALLSFLNIKWDLNFINELTFQAEKVFNGNPSGGDNSTVIFGGHIWFRKENPNFKLIQPLPFTIPAKLSKNFVLINTGKPKETTAEMVKLVKNLYDRKPKLVEKILDEQEKLVKALLPVLKEANHKEFMKIISLGERNLEGLGVVSKQAQDIIRKIEEAGGTAKIIGAGGKKAASGILLAFYKDKKVVENIAKLYNLPYFSTKLGVEGLRKES